MSALTPMASPFASESQAEARTTISAIMASHGFSAYPYEFWHYSAGDVFAACIDGSGPIRYGPISYDPVSGVSSPLPDPDGYVTTPEDIQAAIRGVLGTRGSGR
jgi:hypothetical protein